MQLTKIFGGAGQPTAEREHRKGRGYRPGGQAVDQDQRAAGGAEPAGELALKDCGHFDGGFRIAILFLRRPITGGVGAAMVYTPPLGGEPRRSAGKVRVLYLREGWERWGMRFPDGKRRAGAGTRRLGKEWGAVRLGA